MISALILSVSLLGQVPPSPVASPERQQQLLAEIRAKQATGSPKVAPRAAPKPSGVRPPVKKRSSRWAADVRAEQEAYNRAVQMGIRANQQAAANPGVWDRLSEIQRQRAMQAGAPVGR